MAKSTQPETEIDTIPVRYDLPEQTHQKLNRIQRALAVIRDKFVTQEEALIHIIDSAKIPGLKR